MIKTDYFYRTFGSSTFERADTQREIVPVKLKNKFVPQEQFYSFEKGEWTDGALQDAAREGQALMEFAEKPARPKVSVPADLVLLHLRLPRDIEDYDEEQMRKHIAWISDMRRYKFMRKEFIDGDGIEKDWIAVSLKSDDDALTLEMTAQKFRRGPLSEENADKFELYDTMPQIEEHTLIFDLKNGTLKIAPQFCDPREDEKRTPHYDYISDIDALKNMQQSLPAQIQQEALRQLVALAQRLTGISYERFLTTPQENPLQIMYKITRIPFEPELCDVFFSNDARVEKMKFKLNRRNPDVLKKFLRKAKIKNTKIVRTCYAERSLTLITYMNVRDCGFKDINLFNKVLQSKEYCRVFDEIRIEGLEKFCTYSMKHRGEKPTMNTLLKPSDDFSEKRDAVEMFGAYFKYIPDALKNDIAEDGFTKFNHDALANISWQCKNKNLVFTYTDEQKRLADNVGGLEFALPKDSHHLCEIGTALHNCVVSYADRVLKKRCTIVYAKKGGEYKVCIEVCGNQILQELTDRNANPDEATQKLLDEWHVRHGLLK